MINKIENLLLELTNINNNLKITDIIEGFINKLNYKVEKDIVSNDLRTIYLKGINRSNDIKILSTIIIDKIDDKKKDYVEIYFKNKMYKYYCEY